jgi:P-type Cu2+ transporter
VIGDVTRHIEDEDDEGGAMKTSVIEVGGMLSALSAHGVEKQLAKLRGVERAEVNYVSGSATVVYDETVIDLKAIKARVHECGYHCSGELLPKHLCKPEDPPSGGC